MAVLAGLCCAAVATTACESTQDKSARLEAEADGKRTKDKVVKVTEIDKDIDLRATDVITDPNGTVVIATMRSGAKDPLAQVPVSVRVLDAKGKAVYANDTPGLDPSLTSAVLLPPGEDQVWINDQVLAVGKPEEAKVKVGIGGEPVKGELPRIDVQPPKLENDPTSGLAAVGKVTNRSDVDQKDLVVNVVARSGGEIVAAGRAVVRRLGAGKDADYTAFLIGKPGEDPELEATAPPIVLK